jgi:hypothetical protein
MSFSAVLGTGIGLVFVFALIALFCSGITEAFANLIQKRAQFLLAGLRSMLDQHEAQPAAEGPGRTDTKALFEKARTATETAKAAAKVDAVVAGAAAPPPGRPTGTEQPVEAGAPEPANNDLTLALFNHPLIKSLHTRRILWFRRGATGPIRNPQYIEPGIFVRALIDTLLPEAAPPVGPDTPAETDRSLLNQLHAAVHGLPPAFPARAGLLALIKQAEGSLDRFATSLEAWYDEEMSRISGWYKRWSKVVLGVVGFGVAVLANVDTIQVTHGLYVNEPVRQAVVTAAQNGTLCREEATPEKRASCTDQRLAQLNSAGLPVWYPDRCRPLSGDLARCWAWSSTARLHGWDFPLKLLGWLLTAFAVSFGAPFWFDALSRLGSLRNAGPKPGRT